MKSYQLTLKKPHNHIQSFYFKHVFFPLSKSCLDLKIDVFMQFILQKEKRIDITTGC